MTYPCRSSRLRRERGFTLVELVISIAILFLLITTAFVALKSARKGAERTTSLSTLRQMMTAYAGYSSAHDGRLLPGYVDPMAIGKNVAGANPFLVAPARLPTGHELSPEDSASWVWRLAPYLDGNWQTFMADYRDESLVSKLSQEYGAGDATGAYGPDSIAAGQFGIATHPSFGLNSIYVGGDMKHGDPARAPWTMAGLNWQKNPNPDDVIAATRLSEAKTPATLIVFGASAFTGAPPAPTGGTTLGYMELRPPWADFDVATGPDDQQWIISTTPPTVGEVGQAAGFSAPGGFPIDRLGDDKVPVSHLDGSTGNYDPNEVAGDPTAEGLKRMMSRWSPFAVSWR